MLQIPVQNGLAPLVNPEPKTGKNLELGVQGLGLTTYSQSSSFNLQPYSLKPASKAKVQSHVRHLNEFPNVEIEPSEHMQLFVNAR